MSNQKLEKSKEEMEKALTSMNCPVEDLKPEVKPEETPAPSETPKTPEEPKTEAKVESAPSSETPKTPEAPKEPQVKVASNLFKPFTLGSSLKQGPTGNIMNNVKKPMMDYEQAAKNHKNQQFTSEEMSKLTQKK